MEGESDSSNQSFVKTKIIPFVYKHFLMIGILVALLIGFVVPTIGEWVGRFEGSSYICVIVVFLHSGLKLRTAEVKSVLKEYKAFVFGVLSIMLFSSVIGAKLSGLLPFGEIVSNSGRTSEKNITENSTEPSSIVGPGEFLLGLELYYISPCAIASGIVLTSLASGDVTLALLLAISTNTLGVLVVPLLAKWLVSVTDVQVNVVRLLVKLILTVLIPLLVGKAMTGIESVKNFVTRHTKTLKIISLIFLICIPWMKISKAQSTGSFHAVSVVSLFIMLAWGITLHIILSLMNYICSWILRFKLDAQKTLVIQGSLKTLAISLSVISFLPEEFGDQGLMALPLVVIHLSVLLIDSMWVVHWNSQNSSQDNDINSESKEVDSCSATDDKECTSKMTAHLSSV